MAQVSIGRSLGMGRRSRKGRTESGFDIANVRWRHTVAGFIKGDRKEGLGRREQYPNVVNDLVNLTARLNSSYNKRTTRFVPKTHDEAFTNSCSTFRRPSQRIIPSMCVLGTSHGLSYVGHEKVEDPAFLTQVIPLLQAPLHQASPIQLQIPPPSRLMNTHPPPGVHPSCLPTPPRDISSRSRPALR